MFPSESQQSLYFKIFFQGVFYFSITDGSEKTLTPCRAQLAAGTASLKEISVHLCLSAWKLVFQRDKKDKPVFYQRFFNFKYVKTESNLMAKVESYLWLDLPMLALLLISADT